MNGEGGLRPHLKAAESLDQPNFNPIPAVDVGETRKFDDRVFGQARESAILKLDFGPASPTDPDPIAFQQGSVDAQINPSVEVRALIGDVAFQQADTEQSFHRTFNRVRRGWGGESKRK
jgi:hypothetical protein